MDREGRDIFVISDLHLGDGGMRDNFEAGGKTPELRGFLDHVGSERGELFVLGDLFELWQMNMSVLFQKRRSLLDQFASLPLVYVPGNHDVDLAHFIGSDFLGHPFFSAMRAPFVRELGGKRFRFFHGHEVDPFNAGDNPGFGRMLAIFSGIFEDENGSPILASGESVEDVLEQFGDSMLTLWKCAMATIGDRTKNKVKVAPDAALTPAQNPDRLAEHISEVRADLTAERYDVAVVGHTHQPGHIGSWYHNSGSWTGRANSFLRISSDGHVRHLEWKSGRAVEREPVVLSDARPAGTPSKAKNPFDAASSAVRTFFPRPTKPERSRWALLIQGFLALSLGAGALTLSVGHGWSAGLRLLVTAFGAYAVFDGVLSLLGAPREQPMKRFLYRARGAASILLGLVVLRRGYAIDIFVILVGIWALITGAGRLAASVVLHRMVDSKWMFFMGAGSMMAGLILLFLPASAALLKITLCVYLCYYGFGELMAGIFGRRRARTGKPATSLSQ